MTQLQELREERNKLESKIQELAKTYFKTEVTKVFENNPVLQSFSWRQYTPYFNDGDTCEFGVHSEEIDVVYTDGDEKEDAGNPRTRWNDKIRKIEKVLVWSDKQEALAAALEFLGQFEENEFLVMFGDHAKITANRDGSVEADSYSHD